LGVKSIPTNPLFIMLHSFIVKLFMFIKLKPLKIII
jgi:hypothetical protein